MSEFHPKRSLSFLECGAGGEGPGQGLEQKHDEEGGERREVSSRGGSMGTRGHAGWGPGLPESMSATWRHPGPRSSEGAEGVALGPQDVI